MSFTNIPSNSGFKVEGSVATFNDLPSAVDFNQKIYKVNNDSGIFLINRKYKGLYYSDGEDWSIIEFDSSALDAIADLQRQINNITVQEANNTLENFPCQGNVSVGDWVISNDGMATKALADSLQNSNVIGVVETKANTNTCSIRLAGGSVAIFSNLDTSKEYYLSDINPGQMVAQDAGIPSAPGSVLIKLGQPIDTQRFLVLKGTRIVRS